MKVPEVLLRLYTWCRIRVRTFWFEDINPKKSHPDGGEEAMLLVPISPLRSRFVFMCFVGLLALVIGKAFWLQCVSTEFLQEQGEKRVMRTIDISAQRGKIVDRNGVVLASSIPTRSIGIDPYTAHARGITDAHVKTLAEVLDEDLDEVREKVAQKDKRFIMLRENVDIDKGEKLRAMRIPGLSIRSEVRRNYPDGEVSAHVVGYTDKDGVGIEGVEKASNASLSGRPGKKRVIRDRLGESVEDVWVQEATAGENVVLSVDSRLQFIAHEALKKTVTQYKAKAGAVLVADVRTGEILAMANWPTYNPNDRRYMVMNNVRNRVITDTFEPGSTMKPFAIAKALDLGIVQPDTLISTEGRITVGDRVIKDTHNNGLITVSQVVAKSSNIGTLKIALEMPAQTLWKMYSDLGFGRVPNIKFPGAVTGRMHAAKNWGPVEQATISYGHGISVTLMQLVRAYTALARNGDVIDLTFRQTNREAQGSQVFRPETARQMRAMMSDTVRAGGTARRVSVQGYTVAGKTGTAEKVENGAYTDKYVASFVGMAPVSQPKIIVAVAIDEPSHGSYYGGTVATPAFNEVAAGALRLLNVHPDSPLVPTGSGIQVKGIRND